MDGKDSFEKQKRPNVFKIRSPTNANPSNPSAFAGPAKLTAVYLTFIVYASCSVHLTQQDKRSRNSLGEMG